jgi:hypothetical protein
VIDSRLEIMQSIGLFARLQVALKETYVQVVKITFIYLKGTLDFGYGIP